MQQNHISTVEHVSDWMTYVMIQYIKNQQDATWAVQFFINHCKYTLHVSGTFCAHHQEY